MIGLCAVVLIKLDLEAVTVAVHILYGAEGSVSLAADTNVLHSFTVNNEITAGVLLTLALINEAVPVVHNDINFVDL